LSEILEGRSSFASSLSCMLLHGIGFADIVYFWHWSAEMIRGPVRRLLWRSCSQVCGFVRFKVCVDGSKLRVWWQRKDAPAPICYIAACSQQSNLWLARLLGTRSACLNTCRIMSSWVLHCAVIRYQVWKDAWGEDVRGSRKDTRCSGSAVQGKSDHKWELARVTNFLPTITRTLSGIVHAFNRIQHKHINKRSKAMNIKHRIYNPTISTPFH